MLVKKKAEWSPLDNAAQWPTLDKWLKNNSQLKIANFSNYWSVMVKEFKSKHWCSWSWAIDRHVLRVLVLTEYVFLQDVFLVKFLFTKWEHLLPWDEGEQRLSIMSGYYTQWWLY